MYGVTTGLEAALLTLYEQTKDRKYLDFCTNFKHIKLPEWNAKKKIGWTEFMDDERHVYIHICLCVAQMQLHHINPDLKLIKQSHGVIDYLTGQEGRIERREPDAFRPFDPETGCLVTNLTRMPTHRLDFGSGTPALIVPITSGRHAAALLRTSDRYLIRVAY